MRDENLRYVTSRRRSDGSKRYYWQRPGQPLTRLPDNPLDRYARATALNAAVDKISAATDAHGSVRWVVEKYKASDPYRRLAASTKIYYDRYLGEIERLGPDQPFAEFTRKVVVDFIEGYDAKHQRKQCGAVLKNLFNVAMYHGLVDANHASGLRIGKMPRRDRRWTEDEIAAWLKAAERQPAFMTTAFLLLCYTAQRPSDVLAMPRTHYNGDTITLRQKKTGTLLEVPCHPDLRGHLDALPKAMMLVSNGGRRVSYTVFCVLFRKICAAIGCDAQARDLRRSAMVNMALAGATVPQIASVSGHSIDYTQQIIDTYIPRNVELARVAIAKMPSRLKIEPSKSVYKKSN